MISLKRNKWKIKIHLSYPWGTWLKPRNGNVVMSEGDEKEKNRNNLKRIRVTSDWYFPKLRLYRILHTWLLQRPYPLKTKSLHAKKRNSNDMASPQLTPTSFYILPPTETARHSHPLRLFVTCSCCWWCDKIDRLCTLSPSVTTSRCPRGRRGRESHDITQVSS
jgi:hypothetical protein